MRFLRWVGVLSSLLFVGVLMAPLPSEAVPTLTLQVDNGATTSILGSSVSCGSASYNACYNILTSPTTEYTGSNGRKYTVQRAVSTVVAKLRVGDFLGGDKFQLIGVKIVPVPWTPTPTAAQNTTESHVLRIVMQNTFDTTVNVNNGGNYVFSLRTGGEFIAGPAGNSCNLVEGDNLCDAIGNVVTYTGVGTFSPSLTNVNILRPSGANSQPLSFTVAGPHADPILSFDGATNATMGQVNPTYPTFLCDLDGAGTVNQCRPTITQTLTVTMLGQDTFVLTGTHDLVAQKCDVGISALEQKKIKFLTALVPILVWIESQHNSPTLETIIQLIKDFLATVNSNPLGIGYEDIGGCPGAMVANLDNATLIAADQIQFAQQGAVAAQPAPARYYAVINSPGVSWEDARVAAKTLGGGTCDLATITSGSEQAIINVLLPDPAMFAPAPAQQFWIGGKQGSEETEPGGNWQWINEEGPFWDSPHPDGQNGEIVGKYANWGNETNGPGVGLQPDNVYPRQNRLSVDHRYKWAWDDNEQFLEGVIRGYVAEGPNPCTPPID